MWVKEDKKERVWGGGEGEEEKRRQNSILKGEFKRGDIVSNKKTYGLQRGCILNPASEDVAKSVGLSRQWGRRKYLGKETTKGGGKILETAGSELDLGRSPGVHKE